LAKNKVEEEIDLFERRLNNSKKSFLVIQIRTLQIRNAYCLNTKFSDSDLWKSESYSFWTNSWYESRDFV